MTILDKLHAIEREKAIYEILYRNAGVGFLFYTGPNIIEARSDDWRQHLVVDKYYSSFEEAVEAEFARL